MINADYVAAFIDAEGCFGITKTQIKERPSPRHAAILEIVNTNKKILEKI